MKIAITAQSATLSSEVDPRFGRAQCFAVIDTDGGQATFHDNSVNLNAAQGAGIQTAKRVVDLGVSAILTGHVGPKAFSALKAGGVDIYTGIQGSVAEAVERFKSGALQPAVSADVEGHWT